MAKKNEQPCGAANGGRAAERRWTFDDPESKRLEEDARREKNWKRWGPYLSDRQWGTVREDYSPHGDCWNYFPHDHARSRAYRWGEDGLLGLCDRQGRLCFAPALWNERDPILKERLFGLAGPEGNHGEDVKEEYYHLDATPTNSYLRALYKYPQAEFPYERLLRENRQRGRHEPEFELADCGVFDGGRCFDVVVEYAKASPEDVLIRISATNRGPVAAPLHLLPTIWYRNSWSWGCRHEGCEVKPSIRLADPSDPNAGLLLRQATLGKNRFFAEAAPGASAPDFRFCENETNAKRLYGSENSTPFPKDAFHDAVVHGRADATNPAMRGTKCAARYRFLVEPGATVSVRLRLCDERSAPANNAEAFGASFDEVFRQRQEEADAYYALRLDPNLRDDERLVARQACAGLLWSKQFYHYIVEDWLEGDELQPKPPGSRLNGRNADWLHLYNRDVVSMPDKWEYPWYAAWDLAFHAIPLARLDPAFAKEQLSLFLREWYMHPNGQLPAYEFNFSDVNPPVHAWACWRVYKTTAPSGQRDREFLSSAFMKLLMNFTWWVNRKDPRGKNLFAGGFLGLDNIGVFDRSAPLPAGGHLEQADGTAWMAFYCATMLSMSLDLAEEDPAHEDMASKFFEHFVAIADAMNGVEGGGLWDEEDGFYYDQLYVHGKAHPLRVRSMVGLIPLFACVSLDEGRMERTPGFKKRVEWFLANRPDLASHIAYMEARCPDGSKQSRHLLAIPSRERLVRALRRALDEEEFLSPYGIRSLSKFHEEQPYEVEIGGQAHRVAYAPGESDTAVFGGNSNWRGPIWLPLNYLLIECLERYHAFYGDSLKVECPTGSGNAMTLLEVSRELASRLAKLFLPDEAGRRPCHGGDERYANDPGWRDLPLFYEHFHGDDGRGLGASHQTGWTALVATLLNDLAADRAGKP